MAFIYILHAIFSSFFTDNFQENSIKSQEWHANAHSWLFLFFYTYDFTT